MPKASRYSFSRHLRYNIALQHLHFFSPSKCLSFFFFFLNLFLKCIGSIIVCLAKCSNSIFFASFLDSYNRESPWKKWIVIFTNSHRKTTSIKDLLYIFLLNICSAFYPLTWYIFHYFSANFYYKSRIVPVFSNNCKNCYRNLFQRIWLSNWLFLVNNLKYQVTGSRYIRKKIVRSVLW